MCKDITILLDPTLPLSDPPLLFLRTNHSDFSNQYVYVSLLYILVRQSLKFGIRIILTTRSSGSPSSSPTETSTTSSPSSTSTNPQPSPTQIDPPPSYPTSTTSDPNINDNVFHFYFLIIAIAAIAFFLGILYVSRRKKRKAEIMRSNSQRALARDVEGFRSFGRTRGRMGLGWPTSTVQGNRSDVEEGLDERGEAPPPYVPGTKPPSLRSVERERRPSASSGHGVGEVVELQPLGREVEYPPGYDAQHPVPSSDAGVTRPTKAVPASERLLSTRRLIGHSEGPSEEDGTVIR